MTRAVAGILKRLHEECFVDICYVGGKLAHLVSVATVSIFECNGKHLVGVECRLERNVAESLVHRIFAAVQQTGALQFLIVGAARKS